MHAMLLLYITVPITSVTITPSSVIVIAGQQMNLTCATSYCYPPANITWYLSSVDITSQSLSAVENTGGLLRTVSSLLYEVVKEDSGKQVYCRASNSLGEHVISSVETVNVFCKWLKLNFWIMFAKGNLDELQISIL